WVYHEYLPAKCESLLGKSIVACFGHLNLRSEAEIHSALRADTPTSLEQVPLALWGARSASCGNTLFASERPSPLAPSAHTGTALDGVGPAHPPRGHHAVHQGTR